MLTEVTIILINYMEMRFFIFRKYYVITVLNYFKDNNKTIVIK